MGGLFHNQCKNGNTWCCLFRPQACRGEYSIAVTEVDCLGECGSCFIPTLYSHCGLVEHTYSTTDECLLATNPGSDFHRLITHAVDWGSSSCNEVYTHRHGRHDSYLQCWVGIVSCSQTAISTGYIAAQQAHSTCGTVQCFACFHLLRVQMYQDPQVVDLLVQRNPDQMTADKVCIASTYLALTPNRPVTGATGCHWFYTDAC